MTNQAQQTTRSSAARGSSRTRGKKVAATAAASGPSNVAVAMIKLRDARLQEKIDYWMESNRRRLRNLLYLLQDDVPLEILRERFETLELINVGKALLEREGLWKSPNSQKR